VRQGSDGCDIVFGDGRVRSTLPGDMFLIGEVYGFNGRPDEGLKIVDRTNHRCHPILQDQP
jgi:hypothetical protein